MSQRDPCGEEIFARENATENKVVVNSPTIVQSLQPLRTGWRLILIYLIYRRTRKKPFGFTIVQFVSLTNLGVALLSKLYDRIARQYVCGFATDTADSFLNSGG